MADSEWFYLLEGGQQGPVSTAELAALIPSRVPPDTLVWRDGLAGWTPASGVPELGERLPGIAFPPPGEEPRTLNPLRLFGRCLNLRGAFTRAEFAVVYFGTIALMFATMVAAAAVAAIAGASDDVTGAVMAVLALFWIPISLVTSIGGGIRRLHDLGRPGWWIVFTFLPCVNIVALLYMFLAPGAPEPFRGDSSSGVVVAVVGVLLLLVLLGIIAAIAIPNLMRAREAARRAAAVVTEPSVRASAVVA